MFDNEVKDMHFLYKTNWNNHELSEMSNSHLVNTMMYIWKNRLKWKMDFELFVLDHSDDELLKPIISLAELASMNIDDWIKSTPIYQAIKNELEKRELFNYYEIVRARYEMYSIKEDK